jgi:hypothetical protein
MDDIVVENPDFKQQQTVSVLTAAQHNIRTSLDQVTSLSDDTFENIRKPLMAAEVRIAEHLDALNG